MRIAYNSMALIMLELSLVFTFKLGEPKMMGMILVGGIAFILIVGWLSSLAYCMVGLWELRH